MTVEEIRSKFTKKTKKEVTEFDHLEFIIWQEYRNQIRHEEWVRVNTEIYKLNYRMSDLNERYVKVLEKIEKHLAKLK